MDVLHTHPTTIRQKTIRGGLVKLVSQATNFSVRLASLAVLARLLDPRDFGLVGMVTALTGVLELFKDFGLSTVTVQRPHVTTEQLSTLFWLNVLVGTVLAVIVIAGAPLIVIFYHEPRLFWVTVALSSSFLLNAAGVQHVAILQRQLRFMATTVIEIVSLFGGTAIGIAMALKGYSYWALVGMTITAPALSTLCAWLMSRWTPGLPRRGIGLRSMLRFGGAITLNGLVVYVAYNLEKVLLGRYWGAESIGLYGRAYQLANIPTANLNSAIGGVAFPSLSRVQDSPTRIRSYFVKGYSCVLAMTVPITILTAVFARELIAVVLGPKWHGVAEILRLLTPTILVLALINPLGWLLFSTGMVQRSLRVAFVLAPLVMTSYIVGLPYGPTGVAVAYSTVMTLWCGFHIAWCVRGTPVSFGDVVGAATPPMISGIGAALLAVGLTYSPFYPEAPLMRLIVGGTVALMAYCVTLLFVMNQKGFYMDLLRSVKDGSVGERVPVISS